MRILEIGPYPPPHGGVQTHLVAIREYLRRRGISCAVINVTRNRQPDADEVYYPKSGLEVVKLLLRLRYDVVHLHFGGTLTARLLALGFICTLIPWRKVVLTFHSGGYPVSGEGRGAHRRTLRGFVFRRFDRVIGVNQQLVDLFKRLGVRPDRIRLIQPHALSIEPAESLSPRLQRFFESHTPLLTTVGLLEPEYDLSLQIEALGAVRERFPKAGLVIIGSGSLEADLRTQISGKPYAEHVLLPGDVPHRETLRVIAESDLFLRTTLYDGDSISVREALHIGVPVIATDNQMRPSGVDLIPAPGINALRGAIERRLTNSNGRQSCGPADEQNLEAVFELYQELVKETRS
ncbi:MAG: glycosyltransferase family 4 protein [Acidobacteriota bacterium]